ncbi:MAG: 4-demethylwyosine synthase TYW1 [Candidatus Bathyarchaeota archaeon]|nr:MAG: 4-demethylwyosine synthase TYW1 [Candidatus Bathyarchaeota archaeon]
MNLHGNVKTFEEEPGFNSGSETTCLEDNVNDLMKRMKSQRYHLIGNHSALKRCRWLYNSLVHNRPCYKEKFYGVKSHRCIQMTPTVFNCTLRCLFCWRIQSGDLTFYWDETDFYKRDDPEEILSGCLKAQMRLLSGYKANPKVAAQKLEEAKSPNQVAISLSGEPTLYPRLGELLKLFHKNGFTTFLVSNGTFPEALSTLGEEPTQLYISSCAPDKKTFNSLCRPLIKNAWLKQMETLDLLQSFRCPTVMRMTLVRNHNLRHPEKYAKLVEKANPTYLEPKAYMHVGFSRLRLGYANTPSYEEVSDFAVSLSNETGFNVLNESKESRVFLLSRLTKPRKL